MDQRRPSRDDLQAATDRTVPDVIGPDLRVLFCGINPGLYSAAVGHHFARPGNRFWLILHRAGFTDRPLTPDEERLLLPLGLGITDLVPRATASAAELSRGELRAGREALAEKVRLYRPRRVAVVGIGAYRDAFERPAARPSRQEEALAGVAVWLLPNPSGLNASYPLADMVELFAQLRRDLGREAA